MRVPTKARCVECGRVFDLLDEDEAGEWYYGHDCEPPHPIVDMASREGRLAALGGLLAAAMPDPDDNDDCGVNLGG
jgi:hypothetical protein